MNAARPAAALLLVLAAGCAHRPAAELAPALASGAAALEAAQRAGAPELVPRQFREAHAKLERAQLLAEHGGVREALQLAEQAEADARLAEAAAQAERAERAADQAEAALHTLRQGLAAR